MKPSNPFATASTCAPFCMTLVAMAAAGCFDSATNAHAIDFDAGGVDAGVAHEAGLDATPDSGDGSPDAAADAAPIVIDCSNVVVSTLAGNGTMGFSDGTGGATGTAQLHSPVGIGFGLGGDIFVGDTGNERVRKITANGATTTLAGNGTAGFLDGAAGVAMFSAPEGIAVDASGNVHVADFRNERIRKVAPDGTTTTLAGDGNIGNTDGTGGANGTTEFRAPVNIGIDGAGVVYIADSGNHRIRKVALDGSTTTLAGSGVLGFADGTGGPNGTTQFNGPRAVAVGPGGFVYVADSDGNRIRKVAPNGTTTTLAGSGAIGKTDGQGTSASFYIPEGIAVDPSGVVFVADSANNLIRVILPDGTTKTIAGGSNGTYVDGNGCNARFNGPFGIALSGKKLVIADGANHRIRLLTVP